MTVHRPKSWSLLFVAAALVITGAEFAEPTSAPENVLLGEVVGITDGDTFTLRAPGETHKVRLNGIDAPEKGQAFGTSARQALAKQLFRKRITVHWNERDRYGRILGDVYLDDKWHTWVNESLVVKGWAWHFTRYSDDKRLAEAEQKARRSKVGLWRDAQPVAPWTYRATEEARRKDRRVATATTTLPIAAVGVTAANPGELVYVTNTGKKYHRAGCRFLDQSKRALSLDNAAAGYEPCKVCRPPAR